ncbi:MAG: hypothetical protein M3511_07415 [Deinococcota bacterium]|nr:hypothetical protein [Deinococcota bacterium]
MSKGYQSVVTAKLRCIGSNKEIRGEMSKTDSKPAHPWFGVTWFCTPKLREKLSTLIFCIATQIVKKRCTQPRKGN